MMIAAWYYGELTDMRETVTLQGEALHIADGDSFSIGRRKLRLKGIDAPEYAQTCMDANGASWGCGKASRAALELLLRAPGLSCIADAQDKYARALATCSNSNLPDIAALHVANGMAVSDEFYGLRTYGTEEDVARANRLGIWAGEFIPPSEWRATHPTLRTNTVPAE